MDAGALKTFVDASVKAARAEPSPMDTKQSPPSTGGTSIPSEALPDAGRVRQGWTLYQPPYKDLPGFMSKRALEEHLRLYAGYLDRARSIESASQSEKWRAGETDDVAGACLHELFFQGLTVLSPGPALVIQGALMNRWGSLESWWSEMVAAGMVAKGWAITAVCSRDPIDLQVFATYSHDHGLPPGYVPICVADLYEHAYWIDYGTNCSKYLQEMYRFINWEALDERFTHATR